MSRDTSFEKYRGDGTTRDGRTAHTAGEEGSYIADPSLVSAVNASLAVEQPLLVTGEAGTGKTRLAYSIAAELELGDVESFAVRSDHQGREILYEIDNLQRFYDAQVQDARARDRRGYLRLGPMGRAFESDRRRVVLIDEIDKAPRDFPNDLLNVLDSMTLAIPELDIEIKAKHRPVVIITSNQESQLPNPFLRRCVFHHIEFPSDSQLVRILDERLGILNLTQSFCDRVIAAFGEIRRQNGLRKRPSTSELLAWCRVLHSAGKAAADLEGEPKDWPFPGLLLKNREDLQRMTGKRAEHRP